MTKQTKRYLALIVDPIERGVQKRIMIQAELVQAQKYNPKRDKNAPDLE